MNAVELKVFVVFLILATGVRCQETEEVCLSIPRGPAGPPGPQGPAGDVIQCSCNYTDVENEIRSQRGLCLLFCCVFFVFNSALVLNLTILWSTCVFALSTFLWKTRKC